MPATSPGARPLLVGLALVVVLVIFGGMAGLSAAVNGSLLNPSTIYFGVVGVLAVLVILAAAHFLSRSVMPAEPTPNLRNPVDSDKL